MVDFEQYAKLGKNYNDVNKQFLILKELLQRFKTQEGKSIEVFLQGSYKNNTNINKYSDIDIVVYYYRSFTTNIKNRTDNKILNNNFNISNYDIQKFNSIFLNATYNIIDFKSEVMTFLQAHTKHEIFREKKTIKCQIPNSKFTFDIVCAFQYRLYNFFNDKETKYIEGNFIYNEGNFNLHYNQNRIINFPKQSYKNSLNKDKNCNGKYKETIRIIKNIMKNDLDKKYWIPSFALECILYNVNNKYFIESNKEQRCKDVITHAIILVNSFWEKLLESNELLFIKNINDLSQEKTKEVLIKISNLLLVNLEYYNTDRK